jgi:WD40 repeat protein
MLIILMSVGTAEGATDSWTPSGDMSVARSWHSATLLKSGRVLVSGGLGSERGTAEVYDPQTETWSSTADMNVERGGHTATLLKNGNVLAAGGYVNGSIVGSAELYDAISGTWSLTADMNVTRVYHTATLLHDGRVLVAGGNCEGTDCVTQKSAEIYDPMTQTWLTAAYMNVAREGHTAALMDDGKVLVAGGTGVDGAMLQSAELFDPVTESWSLTSTMARQREGHSMTLLQDGRVMVAGFWDEDRSVELFDPDTGNWTLTGSQLIAHGGALSTLTVLEDGRVLVVGGSNCGGDDCITEKTAELYAPAEGIWVFTSEMNTEREQHTATRLQDGRVLVAGGRTNDGTPLKSSELFTPLSRCVELSSNILQNSCFEDGEAPWRFYSSGLGGFDTVTPAFDGRFAARIEIRGRARNAQLYQYGLPLEPDQQYRLYFAARSNNGRDASLYVHKHGAPFANYGLNGEYVNLGTEWEQYVIDFTTNSLAGHDGRLRFWLAPYATEGTVYWFDNVYLLKVTDGVPLPPVPNPQEPPVPPEGHCNTAVEDNVLSNPGFEGSMMSPWSFYTNGRGQAVQDAADRYECGKAAKVMIRQPGSNVQLYQSDLVLQPHTGYRLRLAAKSTEGKDARLFLQKHGSPYTNYGLNGLTIDLSTEWNVFVLQFTTTNFSTPVNDGRLRIWLAESDAPNAQYYFDDLVMIPIENSLPIAIVQIETESK